MSPNLSRNVLLLAGSNSDIGLEVVKALVNSESWDIHLVGRTEPDLSAIGDENRNYYFYRCDFLNESETDSVIRSVFQVSRPTLALVAVGSLPLENSDLDLDSARLTFETNTLATIRLIQLITYGFLENKDGKLLLFSSVAADRPRLKNFTYGSSKKATDFYAFGLANKVKQHGVQIKILRLGYVYSKMSRNFPAAPFAISKAVAAQQIVATLNKKGVIHYIPGKLRVLFVILRILPWSIFSKLG